MKVRDKNEKKIENGKDAGFISDCHRTVCSGRLQAPEAKAVFRFIISQKTAPALWEDPMKWKAQVQRIRSGRS